MNARRSDWKTDCAGMIATAISKANERVTADDFLSGAVDGDLEVSEECELEIGVDGIGRATRTMSRRALHAQEQDEPDVAANDTGARGDDNDDESDAEDGDAAF